MHPQGGPLYYLVLVVVVVGVLALRMRRLGRSRPLRLERLWIVPVLFAAMMAVLLVQAPPRGLDWLPLGLALTVGAGLGWVRGRTMAIAVDPQTHALNVRASPAAMVFLVALVAIRYGLRSALAGEAGALHLSAALLADLFLMFALGLVGAQRIEMALRASRLLAAHRRPAEGGPAG
jgi:hypothetical protein